MNVSDIQGSAGSIFICYRRHDSADVTGRIYDRLADHFGSERVFIDVEAIRLGYDFRSEIDQTIKVCSVVLVVIGDEWLTEVDGKRRIDDENDRVRIEIESALRREIPIIPVLTRGAAHPTKAMLPASLEALAYRHGTSIRHEHFRTDVDSLISQMEKLLARPESTSSKPAKPNEPTTPVKSTEMTKPPPAIPLVTSTPAIAALKETAGWKRKRLIIVTAVGVAVLLLLAITGLFSTRHESVSPSEVSKPAEPKLTKQEDAAAQYNLGVQYEEGQGVRRDLGKAADLYQKAANQGHAGAQNHLGWLCQNGQGVPKDLGKAAELYQKAADQGNASAQNHLGLLYENGLGVPKDWGKAAELYQKAANSGNADAQNNLGVLYQYGRGVPMDLLRATELYQKAADQGDASAQNHLADAQNHLGWLYQNGQGMPKDLTKAVELYQKAADQGNAGAQTHLGLLYEDGRGVPKDWGKAAELYQKAANSGDADAQNNLGALYEDGHGVPKDLVKATELYQRAANQGNQTAIANLKRLSEQTPTAAATAARLAAIPDFSGTWEAMNLTLPHPLVITQEGERVNLGNKSLIVTNDGKLTYKEFFAGDDKYGHSVRTEGEADLVDTFTWYLQDSVLVLETEFDYRHPYNKHPVGTDRRIIKYQRVGSTPTATEREPVVSQAPSIPNFGGIWAEMNPKHGSPPMRLKVVQSGAQIACYITYTQVFGDTAFLQATISQGKATTSMPQGCAPKFQKPGYNYDNPGINIFNISLRGSTLVYEADHKWTSPCDGHPIGTEQDIRKLQRVSQ